MRIPGEGTDQLRTRKEETQVYQVIKDRGICDVIVYINPANGYKITSYLEGARVCNPENEDDLKKCMTKLKEFHSLGLKVDHAFDRWIFTKLCGETHHRYIVTTRRQRKTFCL